LQLADEALVSAAAANALQLDAEEQAYKRGKYTRWFNSLYINDIISSLLSIGWQRPYCCRCASEGCTRRQI
jgi:hypothetical protein